MAYTRKKDGIFRDPGTGRLYEYNGYSRRIYWSRQMLDDLLRMFPTTLNEELARYLGVGQRTLTRKARELGLEKDPEWLSRVWEERRKWATMAARRKGYPGTFRKGHHANRGTEFKPGNQLTPEQQEKRRQGIHRWALMNPSAVKARAQKAWETRRRNAQ